MGKLRILHPNVLGSQAAIATANSQASLSLAASNVLTSKLWQKWRSASSNPADTIIFGQINGDPLFKMDGIALAGLSMVPGNGEVMAVLMGGGLTIPAYTAYQPTSIVASSGITGVVGDVDEGIDAASDGAYIKPTGTSGSFVTLALANPIANPRAGARRQAFALRVKASVDTSGGFAFRRPTVTVKLYENVGGVSTFRRTLGTKAVFGTAAHLLFFSWDASDLATADGSDAQVRVEFSGNSVADAWLDAIEWQCESDHITGTTIVAETDWSTILPDPVSGLAADYSAQDGGPRRRWSYKFSQSYDAARVYIFLREDYVPAETATASNRFLLRTPQSYVEMGKLAAGLWWEPAINRAQGQFLTITDPSTVVDGEDGDRWGSRSGAYDDLRISLDRLTENEVAWLRQRIFHEVGTLGKFYIELEPDSTFELGAGGWATIISNSVQVTRRNTDTYKYGLEFSVRIFR